MECFCLLEIWIEVVWIELRYPVHQFLIELFGIILVNRLYLRSSLLIILWSQLVSESIVPISFVTSAYVHSLLACLFEWLSLASVFNLRPAIVHLSLFLCLVHDSECNLSSLSNLYHNFASVTLCACSAYISELFDWAYCSILVLLWISVLSIVHTLHIWAFHNWVFSFIQICSQVLTNKHLWISSWFK